MTATDLDLGDTQATSEAPVVRKKIRVDHPSFYEKDCSELFPNHDGVIVDTDSLARFAGMSKLVVHTYEGKRTSLKLVVGWTGGKARDVFFLKKQYNYAVTHRNMSADKAEHEHETVHFKCNHRKTPGAEGDESIGFRGEVSFP